MKLNLVSWKGVVLATAAVLLLAALACGAAEETTTTAAPAQPKAPEAAAAPMAAATGGGQAAAPEAPQAAQAAAAAVQDPSQAVKVEKVAQTKTIIERDAPVSAAVEGFQYVPEPQVPGVYWDFVYTGPAPTQFGENPKFAEMVKAGQLPPVEDRLPEQYKIVQPPHGIGTYGGTWRITSQGSGPSNRLYWHKKNSDEFVKLPHVGFHSVSEDGLVYTFTLRKGLKWSDGEPMTMEDIRFAWEDVNLNKVLHETPQTQWLDSVTGEIVEFAVVDDLNWTLTWDSPDFILMEGEVRPGSRCTSFYFCFYTAAHYMKQFHEDYADAAELKAMIDAEEAGDWPRFWGLKNNESTHLGKPLMSPFVLESHSDTLNTWTANPFFFEVDPHGNQLPYIDGYMDVRVESREVGVFRGMAGETDLSARGYQIPEIPLYRSNQEKGDYHLKIWPQVGPGDFTTSVIQTYNTDPEIGKWLRTHDFRQAMSIALDREAINDTILLGIGTVKNWVAHPATPYYPGDQWAFHNTDYDPDKANEILDSLGLSARDSEGFRLRSDGSGERLSFRHLSELGPTADIMELETDYFADVGLEVKNQPMNAPWTLSYPGKEYFAMLKAHFGYYGANPWFSGWTRCCATGGGPAFSPDISDLPRSMGRGPDGAVPTEGGYQPRCDCEVSSDWQPQAPADTYPADPTGTIAWLHDNWHKGRALEQYSPGRIEIGKEIHRIHGEQKFMLSVAAHTGASRGIVLVRNNFFNAPETHIADTVGFYGELYFFENGEDNIGQMSGQ